MREADRSYLRKEEIARLPHISGIYFLYQDNGMLVYIGKASSLRKRVPQHNWQKQFSYMVYEPCHRLRLDDLEKQYLQLYESEHGQLPFYNKNH